MAEATDLFESYKSNLASSCEGVFAITPSDVDELSYVTRAVRIGNAAGTLSVVMRDGTTAELPVQAYEILPLRVKQVKAATTVDCWGLI